MVRRKGFQDGSLSKRGTRKKVWVGRWYEDVRRSDGTLDRIRRSEILGMVAEHPTKRQAQQLLDDLLRRVNSGNYRPQSTCTFRQFAKEIWAPEVYPTL